MKKPILVLLLVLGCSIVALAQDIFHPDSVLEVKIYFEEPEWRHILDSLKEDRNEERLDGKAYVNGALYEKVAVRFKGNSSYHSAEKNGEVKLPINIKFHKDNKLPGGYNRLKLANGFRDPSFIREVLSYEIARKYIPAPKANFAKVFINDEYLGLYTSAEDVDKTFLGKHYGYEKGVMFKCDPDWRAERPEYCPEGDKASLMYLGEDSLCYQGLYELKSKHGWSELIQLTKLLEQPDETLEEILDIEQTLWMLAFDNVLVNLDSYVGAFSHNYYLYQDSSGRFHPILWDMNLSFGGFTLLTVEDNLKTKDLQQFSLFTNYNNEKRPLTSKLLKNDFYRKIYVAHAKTILEENFFNGLFYERVDSLMSFVDTLVQKDYNKLYTYEDFLHNRDTTVSADGFPIIGLKELIKERVNYLKDHPLIKRESPQIADVQHEQIEDKVQIEVKAEGADQVWLYYRSQHNQNFSKIKMKDGIVSSTGSDHSKIWFSELPAGDVREYYIIAEGEKAVTLAPRRASKEFFSVSDKKNTE
jgi:hypothetical protein